MTEPSNFDDLLGTPPSENEKSTLAGLADGGVPAETAEQARIRELEAKLAAAEAAAVPAPAPKPSEAEFERARAEIERLANPSLPTKYEEPVGDTIVIHILRDGTTLAGTVWEKNQTLEFVRGGAAYRATIENGVSWLEDLSDEAQIAKWGRVRFGVGPGAKIVLPPEVIDPAEAKRGTRVPVLR